MKTAMVWGAAGGIGRAIVQELVRSDWRVLAIARAPVDLSGLTPHVFEADVSNPKQVEAAVFSAALEAQQIDLWVYAIGDILSQNVAKLLPAQWSRIVTSNLTGAYLATHHSLPLLAEDASLVYLGAVSERLRLPGLTAYAAAKAGLEAFAESLAKEERKKKITVVRPGAVNTSLWDKVPMKAPSDAPSPEKVAARILEACLNGHKGQLDLTH